MLAPNLELAAAMAIVDRILVDGFHVRVDDGEVASLYKGNRDAVAIELQQAAVETLIFAAPPVRPGDRYAQRGWLTFAWGNGEDVVADYADNIPTRKILGTLENAYA